MTSDELYAIDDDIGDHSRSMLLFRLSLGYIETSIHTWNAMSAGTLPLQFANAQPAHFLLDHATELFLKAAIDAKVGVIITSHNIASLYKRYRDEYPDPEFSLLPTRFIDGLGKVSSAPDSIFARYPVDKKGDAWANNINCYGVLNWLDIATTLKSEFTRVISLISPLPPAAF